MSGRYRIVIVPRPGQGRDHAVTLDHMVFDVTINDGRLADDVARTVLQMLHLSVSCRIARVEPLAEPWRPDAEQLRAGVVPGLTREEVDDFLAAIGYPDAMDA